MDEGFRPTPHHVAISVADLEASVAWYVERLGFVEESRYRVPEAGMRAAFVTCHDVRLEIFEIDGSSPPPAAETVFETHLSIRGPRHLAFGVDQIDTTRELLRSRGVELVTEVLDVPDGSRTRYCFLTDPDGVLIELVETDPSTPAPRRRRTSAEGEPGAAL